MGIKGIYQELGKGQRIALAKLAAESLEKEDRPLRLAIDISIWQFQTQAAKGLFSLLLDIPIIDQETNYHHRWYQPRDPYAILQTRSSPCRPNTTDICLRWTSQTSRKAKQAIR